MPLSHFLFLDGVTPQAEELDDSSAVSVRAWAQLSKSSDLLDRALRRLMDVSRDLEGIPHWEAALMHPASRAHLADAGTLPRIQPARAGRWGIRVGGAGVGDALGVEGFARGGGGSRVSLVTAVSEGPLECLYWEK
jgi:hypothetical protein